MKGFSTFFLLLFCSFFGLSQAPGIEWENTIGGSFSDGLNEIHQTVDGGYILAGSSFSNISGDKTENCQGSYDYWVVKLNAAGNIEWQNTIGGQSGDELQTVQQTTDGGYILGGFSHSNISGDKTENSQDDFYLDFWIVKLDTIGNIQWQNTIGGSGLDVIYALQQTLDGGYILGGYSNSNISGDKTENSQSSLDYWVVKLDAGGNILWQNTIGGSDAETLISIHQTVDGGYILGGTSASNISGDKTENCKGIYDFWIVKLDSSGNIGWQKTIGGANVDAILSIQLTTNGGYILGGTSNSNISGDKTENRQGDYDYWIVKIDASGNIQWQNTIGGSDTDYLRSLQNTSDGGFILGGISESNISGDKTEKNYGDFDFWVVKLNSSGNIQWQNTLSGSLYDELFSIQQTSDGGYILGGVSESNFSCDKSENSVGQTDFWVIKLLEGICPNIQSTLTITPQICQEKTRIISSIPTCGVSPYSYKLNDGNYQTSRTFTVTESGDYTVTVKDANNCTATSTASVSVVPKLNATVSKINVTCFGAANGSAAANPSGGTLPYTFQWKQGTAVIGTNQTIGGLAPAAYKLIVTDAQNCSKTVSFSITQPGLLSLNMVSTVPQGSNFKVRLAASGGMAGAKMYRRCDPGGNNCTAWQTSYLLTNTPAGTYQFQVKDASNCTATVNSAVPLPALPPAEDRNQGLTTFENLSNLKLTFELSPNPARDAVQIIFSEKTPTSGTLEISNLDGKMLRSFSLKSLAENENWVSLENLPAGIFVVTVRAENLVPMTRKLIKN